ncbi:DNA mismatch repair protein MutS [Haladaptatus sp. DYSN1]|uniref:DNA mismatch repair protein MutS n=1 Tax=unclassified Haladaptatus TaxID=2622732 RepID=UPI002404BA56|nr:DNA mismatch repair protein MutS [Haladaptatus sp. DYSN1]
MTEATGIVGEFLSLKESTDADILAMQCGDFYEFFADDAELVGEELDLKVSQKSSHGSSYPMAGVPLKELTPYLKALVERGYRVAVADQYDTEDGGLAREIVRVVTPGTLLETTSADAQYLAAVVRGDDAYGLAFADVTTGHFHATEVEDADAALTELYRFAPAEILPGPEVRGDETFLSDLRSRTDASLSLHAADAFAPGRARHTVAAQFGDEALASVGLEEAEAAIQAAGAVLAYVDESGVGVLQSMTRLHPYRADDHVELDSTTQRNLELAETMGRGGQSLFGTLDHTVTSPGGRLLKSWLQRPRRSPQVLEVRQQSVAALAEAALAREEIRDVLGDAYDVERLASRAASGSAGASQLLQVRDTLALLPDLADAIDADPTLSDSPLASIVANPDREAAAGLHDALDDALADDPPATVTQGGLFRYGYDDELDRLIERHDDALDWIETLAGREKSKYGISHLQVDRNRTDGYYIQVGKSQVEKVPDAYREIKTLKNSKRYTIPELEEKERDILQVEEQRGELEYELFQDLRAEVAAEAALLQDVGRALAELDVLASFAAHAAKHRWVCPELADHGPVDIEAGRHPVVEQTTEFVPNDARLDDNRSFLIVTGPNMSGKSTYMRQVALIVLLAQVGSYVPAKAARIGLVDGIFTRVGALDELAQGRSTFMVEMQELANILHSASEDSLVILDEVGRGTATYDGISIAWAATEYLVNEISAKTLFATHYHELTSLAGRLPGVHNVHMGADERDGDVTFLRTIREGAADRSYGVHVAELAGVPRPVVSRADDVLSRLRTDRAIDVRGSASGTKQVVFDLGSGQLRESDDDSGSDVPDPESLESAAKAVLDELGGIDVNSISPVELMAKVQQWQDSLEK